MTTPDPTKLADERRALLTSPVAIALVESLEATGDEEAMERYWRLRNQLAERGYEIVAQGPTPPRKLKEAAENLLLCFSSRTARESGIYDEWNALDAALSRK